jgi:hypothetical protein
VLRSFARGSPEPLDAFEINQAHSANFGVPQGAVVHKLVKPRQRAVAEFSSPPRPHPKRLGRRFKFFRCSRRHGEAISNNLRAAARFCQPIRCFCAYHGIPEPATVFFTTDSWKIPVSFGWLWTSGVQGYPRVSNGGLRRSTANTAIALVTSGAAPARATIRRICRHRPLAGYTKIR